MVVANYLLIGMILQAGNIYICLYMYYESPECAPKLIHTILRSLRQELHQLLPNDPLITQMEVT